MRLGEHNLSSLRAFWAQHHWRLLAVLLIVACIGAGPIAGGMSCQALAPVLSLSQPAARVADLQAHVVVVASQPGYTLLRIVGPAAEPNAPDALCSYIGSGAPRGAVTAFLFLDKVMIAVGLALFSAILLRRLPAAALLLPPPLRFPPPTPPPIALFRI